ncbi:restriction endonuclease subunit S [Avibacterium avium]|uniref:restriction endonuclease subunit S n=1 Tax=Avibacterium avium TaxID=751 RepID=UPI003BF8AA63
MNYLEKLLQGAPVEWKTLGEVFNLKNGYTPSKSKKEYWENGTIPWFRMEDIRENGRVLNSALQKVSMAGVKGGKLFPANSIMLSTTATIGEHALIQTDYLSNQQLTNFTIKEVYKDILDIKFCFYYFFIIGQDIKMMVGNANLPIVSIEKLKKFKIPIPPLAVQKEIARILDAFTAITSELTSELTLRQKQYQHYRDKLLTFGDEVEWKTIEEIFNLKNGYTPSKSKKEYWENGTIPWFRMEDIRENGRVLDSSLQKVSEAGVKGGKLFPANSIIVATSATIGEHALITVPFLANQRFTVLTLKDEFKEMFSIKFIFYYCFLLDEWCKKNTTKSSFSSVDMAGFKNFPVPIPPIEEQKRIAGILDKFHTLTSSLSDGLPKEIELRQKQYEYYRDLLLNFKQDEASLSPS